MPHAQRKKRLRLCRENLCEIICEAEPTPMEIPVVSGVQPMPEPEPVQTNIDLSARQYDLYRELCLECQEPDEVTYAKNMYENGNIIGIMDQLRS